MRWAKAVLSVTMRLTIAKLSLWMRLAKTKLSADTWAFTFWMLSRIITMTALSEVR